MKTIAMKLAGRCANGFERGQGVKFHALPEGTHEYTHGPALCGQEGGRRSVGWVIKEGATVTCPRCLRKIEQQDAADVMAEQESNYSRDIDAALGRRP